MQDVHNNSEADRFIQALFSHIFKDIKILFLLNIEINIWNASCTPLPLPNLTPANRDPALLANERPVF